MPSALTADLFARPDDAAAGEATQARPELVQRGTEALVELMHAWWTAQNEFAVTACGLKCARDPGKAWPEATFNATWATQLSTCQECRRTLKAAGIGV